LTLCLCCRGSPAEPYSKLYRIAIPAWSCTALPGAQCGIAHNPLASTDNMGPVAEQLERVSCEAMADFIPVGLIGGADDGSLGFSGAVRQRNVGDEGDPVLLGDLWLIGSFGALQQSRRILRYDKGLCPLHVRH
jgi:hypothetical protein